MDLPGVHVPCLIGLLADMRQAQGHYVLHCANCSARSDDSWKGARPSCRAQVVRACGGGIRVHPCRQRLNLAGYAYLGLLENPSIRRHGDGTTSTAGKSKLPIVDTWYAAPVFHASWCMCERQCAGT